MAAIEGESVEDDSRAKNPEDSGQISCFTPCTSTKNKPIGHFTVVCLVNWPLSGNEAGGDLVLIQTLLLFTCKSCCSHAN